MNATPSSPSTPPRYGAIAIGGSAGSIDVLALLLGSLPPTLRAAVFIVLHLPRERPSLLCSIFQPGCALPLREAMDKEPVAPGTVYFAPPDYHLLLDEGPSLALSVDEPVHYSRPSIDVLFQSAADAYAERLVGIVLSGASADGARGLASIHEGGGLTIAQAPLSAAMPTMPQAAIDQVPAALVLPPDAIAARLSALHQEGEL